MAGSASERSAVVTASARSVPALMYPIEDGMDSKVHLHLPPHQIAERGSGASIWHVYHVDARHHLEQLAGNMGCRSIARRRHVDVAWIALGIGDEFRNGLGGNRRVHLHDEGCANNARDWRYVADEIEVELFVERRVDGIRRADQEDRISIRGRIHHRLGGEVTAGARAVLNDELLT